VPLASDAMAEGEAKQLAPAEKAEAAPAAPAPGTPAAPERKPEPPSAKPSAKPAQAEPKRATTPPPPRATASLPGPQQASPTQKEAPETETAMSAPPPERATSERGKAPNQPGTGKAAQTGFATMAVNVPGGDLAAAFDPYLAGVRDKIMTQRDLLRTFRHDTGQVVVVLILDQAGRLQKFEPVSLSGSMSLANTVLNMIARAPSFGSPPAPLVGAHLYFTLGLPDTEAEWEQMMATGRPAKAG
jgi:outer membrane biosynthesis protein TonB